MNTSRAVVLASVLVLGIGLIFGWNLLRAQSAPSGRLSEAVVLLAQGQPREAAELIDGIGANDRDYYVAQCYRALCFYALGDKKGFWKTLDPMPVRNAIPAEIKEDVCVKQMDAFLHFGKFESLVRKISEFEESYPASVRMAQAQEYRLAGLFEKGRKIARDAFRSAEESQFERHWSVAETNLQQFLTLAVSRANYTEVPGRSLREEVWVARILLGDEAVFEEVQDRAGREKLSLLRLELAVDLERESVDTNLRRLDDFLDEFPEPAERERLEKAAAVLYFRKGRQLVMNGELALARDYFEAQRAIADRDSAMLGGPVLQSLARRGFQDAGVVDGCGNRAIRTGRSGLDSGEAVQCVRFDEPDTHQRSRCCFG